MGANVVSRLELPERYELARHVATGGMASVWCAHDRELGRKVAIKVLAEQFEGDEAAVQRFKREARTQARLSSHPHIVQVFDVQHVAGRTMIVMEYLPGGTVADAIRVGAVDRDQAIRWLREAAGALDYAHRADVVHRDIKPGNFLLDRDRTLRVGDFGIARVVTEETLTSSDQLFGTAAYISPEQVLGQPATTASDRYAFAVTAFELLVGTRPFDAPHFAAQARQHLEEEPPAASKRDGSLPRALDPVLARGLAKRPEQRWPTTTALVTAIEDALGDAPASRPFLGALEGVRSSRPIRSSRPVRPPVPVSGPRKEAPQTDRTVITSYHSDRARFRAGALAALAAFALAVVLVAAASGGGHAPRTLQAAAAQSHRTAKPSVAPSARRSSVPLTPALNGLFDPAATLGSADAARVEPPVHDAEAAKPKHSPPPKAHDTAPSGGAPISAQPNGKGHGKHHGKGGGD